MCVCVCVNVTTLPSLLESGNYGVVIMGLFGRIGLNNRGISKRGETFNDLSFSIHRE